MFSVERLTFITYSISDCFTDDLSDINHLNKEALGQTRVLSEEKLGELVDNPDVILVVARDKHTGRIIGKQTLYRFTLDDGEVKAYLEQVATDPNRERQGIARSILEKLTKIARDEGIEFIDWTSSGKKEAAQGYYDKMPGCERRQTNNFRFRLR